MATRLKDVDVVLVGLGLTGGILAKELSAAGLKVVGLERGIKRETNPDFAVPQIRDELRYAVRTDLMMDTARDTITFRHHPKDVALPMRRLGAFCRAKAWVVRACTGMGFTGGGCRTKICAFAASTNSVSARSSSRRTCRSRIGASPTRSWSRITTSSSTPSASRAKRATFEADSARRQSLRGFPPT